MLRKKKNLRFIIRLKKVGEENMSVKTIKNSYINWIRENTNFNEVLNQTIEVSSPFMSALNENIKIYVIPNSTRYKITDDGYTLWNLESLGMNFRKGSRRESLLLNAIDRSNLSMDPKTKELFIYSTQQKLGNSMHTMIQSILTITDMLRFNTSTVRSLFFDEVNKYFDENKELYDPFPDVEIQGKSKLLHRFDYLMTLKHKQKKLVKLINNLDKSQVERTIMGWQDTTEQRTSKYNENLKMVALINDSEKVISTEFEDAFTQYGIETIGFSDKKLVEKSLSVVS